LLASVIITAFPFYLLALLKAKGSIGPIFSFFLKDFLKAFLALYFCGELAVKISSKDIDLLNLESSSLALGTFLLNINKLYSVIIFKPLIFLEGNNRGPKVTSSSIDSSSSVLIVETSTKS
jgi:hypothetical protein